MRKLYFLAFIIYLLIFLSACNNSNETTETMETITSVETIAVETGDFIVEKNIFGHISAMKQIPVMVQQPGEVTSLKVENGDKVEKDEHLATIKTAMGNQRINAPADGEIAQLSVDEEAFQSNEEPLAMIVELEKVKVSFTVTPTVRKQFEKDNTLKVFIENEEYEAKITALDTLPNETGQFTIEAEINNEDREILPGMIAEIVLTDKRVADTIIVPSEAILSDNEDDFVFIINDNQAKKVMVEIQETQSDITAIKADLQAEDQIIVNGHFTLQDGNVVEVVKEGK